mgnify:CR=1 FL=1
MHKVFGSRNVITIKVKQDVALYKNEEFLHLGKRIPPIIYDEVTVSLKKMVLYKIW